MKAHLLFRDRDLALDATPPENTDDLVNDLELQAIIDAMSRGDAFLTAVASVVLLHSLGDADDIAYRQQILLDCFANEATVRQMYDLAIEAIARQRDVYGWVTTRDPSSILAHAIDVLEVLCDMLQRLRQMAEDHAGHFRSEGFERFFAMLRTELSDEYFHEVEAHLRRLRLRDGVLISARLGTGGKGMDLVMRRPAKDRPGIGERLSALTHPAASFRVSEHDEGGCNAITELTGRGVNPVADALARSTDHILDFFGMLRTELGFWVGCLNLAGALAEQGQPTCVPTVRADDAFACEGLYDAALALVTDEQVVGNDVNAASARLVVITGANQGGKSTFLRSVGQAQLMMQCGMFVAATAYSVRPRSGVFTHFTHEEDPTMSSGKLDEELARMSDIADTLSSGALVLFNESFASTNEREGSEIGRQVAHALLTCGITVFFVTHQYDLAHGLAREGLESTVFLRAGRDRTFKLESGEPLPTSFGGDLYRKIFGTEILGTEITAQNPARDRRTRPPR